MNSSKATIQRALQLLSYSENRKEGPEHEVQHEGCHPDVRLVTENGFTPMLLYYIIHLLLT